MSQGQTPHIYLASTSRYRAELLSRLHLPFETFDPGIDETAANAEAPAALARRLAQAKAQANSPKQGLIIGSDQVAACQGRVLGKPGDSATAHAQLRFCSGKTVTFHTGLALWMPEQDRLLSEVVPYQVTLRDLSTAEIDRYLAIDHPFDCAGSFKWEALGIALFEHMEGSDPTSLQGLPLIALCRYLRAQGVLIPPQI